MKLKKKIMVILAAGIMVLSAAPLALADETPAPAANEQVQTQTANTESVPAETASFANSKYLTKGWAAFWFILLFVANGAFSFWVGNRFYRLARKDNHVSGEIRALRRDIEDKFVKSVDGFAEQEFNIENHNPSLAPDNESIKQTPKKMTVRELSPEEEERFRKWEAAQSKPRTEKTKSAVREEQREEFDNIKKINRKNYQPKREITEEVPDADEADNLDETKVINVKTDGVKNKAKEIINDIFPFKED